MKTVLPIIILILAVGCSRTEGRKAFDKGNRLMKSGRPGDLEKSVAFFKKSIELEMRARNQLVSAYKKLAKQSIARAGWSMKKGDLDKHVRSRAASQAGVSAISLRLYNTAVGYFNKALKLTPNDRFIHFHLGVCHAQLSLSAATLGDRALAKQRAAAAYKTAMRLDKKYDAPAYGLALLRMHGGDFKGALEVLQGIMRRKPKSTRVYFIMARCYYGMKQYGKAESMYRVLLDLLPSSSPKQDVVRRNILRLRQMQ